PHARTLARRHCAPEPAPAFRLRLSFWRFVLPLDPATEQSTNTRSKAAEKTAALQDAGARHCAPESASAFGLRLSFLSFWRFLLRDNPGIEPTGLPRLPFGCPYFNPVLLS